MSDFEEYYGENKDELLPYYTDDIFDFLYDNGYIWTGILKLPSGRLLKSNFNNESILTGNLCLFCRVFDSFENGELRIVDIETPTVFPFDFKINLFEFKRLDKNKKVIKDYSFAWQNFLLEYYNPVYSQKLKSMYGDMLKIATGKQVDAINRRIDQIENMENNWDKNNGKVFDDEEDNEDFDDENFDEDDNRF